VIKNDLYIFSINGKKTHTSTIITNRSFSHYLYLMLIFTKEKEVVLIPICEMFKCYQRFISIEAFFIWH